jgi:peptidoglycan/LPS O-acetylase OafA/YrhL
MLESDIVREGRVKAASVEVVPSESKSGRHLPALDGVRGVAILLVLCVHLFVANPDTKSAFFNLVTAVFQSCYIGVNLFFVLSGFLITGILLDTIDFPHFFSTFYVRRSLRIFPLYYGVLIALLVLTRPLHLDWGGWKYQLLTYTSNLSFWRPNQLIPLHPFNINHFWSLQVEEQFYLVWPFLVFRLRQPRKIIRLALVGCLVVFLIRVGLVFFRSHFQNVYIIYSPTFSCADNLLYGCCLCALLRTSARATVVRFAPVVFGVAAAVVGLLAICYHGLNFQSNAIVPTIGFSTVGIGSAALIAMSLQENSRAQRFFGLAVLRFFGKYSYGLYVFHYTLAEILTVPIRLFIYQHFHSRALGVVVGAGVVMGVSVLVALISYHFYELPFLNLKRYFSYNRKTSPLSVAA